MESPTPGKSSHLESFSIDDASVLSSSSQYPESLEDGDFQEVGPARQTMLLRLLTALGMNVRRRRGGYEAASADDIPAGLLKNRPEREVRRCRKSHVFAFLKRAMVAFPILVLLFFGALHILQVLVGRAWLFWDLDEYAYEFMPNWGKAGHPGAGLAHYPTDATRDVLPIPCHSHNDYWRRVPMFDAIHWGCTSIEADVWNFDEELYVGHNLASLTKNRTLNNLYLNPLVELLDHMNKDTDFTTVQGHGVFDVDPQQTLVLLIDFKTSGQSTFPLVWKQLEPLREKGYLTFWDGNEVQQRAVTVVGTGNTPFDMVVNSTTHRDIFFDAPLDKMWEHPRDPISSDDPIHDKDGDLDYGDAMSLSNSTTIFPPPSGQGRIGTEIVQSVDDFNPDNSYYASTSFTRTVGFVWRGHLSPRQMDIIRGQIRGAKRRGLKARYWDTPSWPIALRNHVWHVLMKEGADVLNVDDLRAAAVDNWKLRVHDWFN